MSPSYPQVPWVCLIKRFRCARTSQQARVPEFCAMTHGRQSVPLYVVGKAVLVKRS